MVAKLKAQNTVRDELKALHRKHKVLRACDVVKFARNENTALHGKFEWDDSAAGEKFRLIQAGQIIRLHVNVLEDPKARVPMRAWVSLREDRKQDGGGYRSLAEVMSDDEMKAQLLQQAKDEADNYRERYQALKELAPVFMAMEKVFGGVTETAVAK